MSNEEENSFLLVGMSDDDQEKSIHTAINRDSSSIITKNDITENITPKKISQEKTKKNSSYFYKILNKLLSLDKPKKNKKEKFDEDFFNFGFFDEKKKKYMRNFSNSFDSDGGNVDTSFLNYKKKSIIKSILELKKENEWNEFIKRYKKEHKEKNKLKKILKNTFNINSDFINIWKIVFSLFYMLIFFFIFVHFIFFNLLIKDSNDIIEKRYLYLYHIINLMFVTDLVLSLLVIIANRGSLFSYLKIPIKIYLAFPFPLKKSYIIFIIPKFCRIDLFRRVFYNIEQFILKFVTPYIQDYHLKIFILYINRLFAYLLEFGLYAHFACCVYSYLDDVNYINGLYYTIEIITTIGYGEHSPKNMYSMGLVMITIFIGSNLIILTNCIVNFLTTKIRSFTRMTSSKEKFMYFRYNIQSSIGRLFPINLKESLYSFFKYHHHLSFNHIKSEYSSIFYLFKPRTKEHILNSSLNFLRLEFESYFPDCEMDFINELFEASKPRIYKENKIIINIGKKVNKLYFLLNGILFAFDKNNKNIFTINNNSIFCEYEFINGYNCQYQIKSHPKIPAFGFIINKSDWENISKKYIYSANKFIKLCVEKRNYYIKKINQIYNRINKCQIKNKDLKNDFDVVLNSNIFEKINKYRENVAKTEKYFVKLKQELFEYFNYK